MPAGRFPSRYTCFSQNWHVAVACAPTCPHLRGPTASLWAALLHPVAGLLHRAADQWADRAAGWWATGGAKGIVDAGATRSREEQAEGKVIGGRVAGWGLGMWDE